MLLSAFSRPGADRFRTQQWLAWADDAAGQGRQRAAGSSSAIVGGGAEGESGGGRGDRNHGPELGAGLGIALFGLILTRSYSATIALSGLNETMAQRASSSIGEAVRPDPGATRRWRRR